MLIVGLQFGPASSSIPSFLHSRRQPWSAFGGIPTTYRRFCTCEHRGNVHTMFSSASAPAGCRQGLPFPHSSRAFSRPGRFQMDIEAIPSRLRDDEAELGMRAGRIGDGTDGPAALDQMSHEELARLTGQYNPWAVRSRQFRQHAETICPHLRTRLAALVEAASAIVPRERISKKLAPNIELLALNLYAAYRQDDRLCIGLPMAPAWYSDKAPRNPILSYRITVKQAWAGLVALGYAELIRKGSPWGNTFSLVRATPLLVAFLEDGAPPPPCTALRLMRHPDPIVLKAPKASNERPEMGDEAGADSGDAPQANGQPMRFPDTPETARMRSAVQRINAVNTPDRIRLPALTEEERWDLFEAISGHQKQRDEREKAELPLSPEAIEAWFAQTDVHRVFNRGDFACGGRFYGAAWQMMPGRWRKRILIDGQPVTELDFGSLHPRMAHHLLERVEAPADCYAGIQVDREIAKRTVSALLNMENGTSRPPLWFKVEEAGMRWASLVTLARAALPHIAHHFGTGAGLRLQRVDSEIAEAVMLHFAEREIPCLGVHDSFIVRQPHAEELAAVMRQVYRDRIRFEPVIPIP